MPKTSTKKKVSKGVAIEASVDDLHNLREDEKGHELMWLNRIINALIKNDISTISQLKSMYDKYGEEYCISKISEIKLINKKMAENILTKAVCYEYPKGYTPIAHKLPNWITDGAVAKVSKKEVIKKEEPVVEEVNTPAVEETELVNVEEYISNYADESEFPTLVLNLIFDVFEDDTYCPERIVNRTSYNYEQQQLYYNNDIVLIQKEFLQNLFTTKYVGIRTAHNVSPYNIFHIGLKSLKCIYSYEEKKTGMRWWWGRKWNLLGTNNQLNYIEVRRAEAEAMINRKFNIASDEEISQIMEDLGFNSVDDNDKVSDTSNEFRFYIIPESCAYENGKYAFKFNIAEIKDRFEFNMKNIDWKSGSYVFNKNDIKNGELMLSRGFTNKDYDEILILVGDFLTK